MDLIDIDDPYDSAKDVIVPGSRQTDVIVAVALKERLVKSAGKIWKRPARISVRQLGSDIIKNLAEPCICLSQMQQPTDIA